MEAELYKQNPWWEGTFEEKSHIRDVYLTKIFENLKTKEIIFLTGLRRIGKTTLMMQAIARLLVSTVPQDILFLNLDSFAFINHSIHDLVHQYRALHKKSVRNFFYLFLDEVTRKDNFEQELKSLYDNDNVKIICSSSVATYMRDKRAFLTGRTKTIEVMPLTFQEFLQFKGVSLKISERPLLESYFKDYLRIGGIPHYVLTEDHDYLTELVDHIIYKDIVAYHNLTNEKVIRDMFVLLCERVGKIMSYNKLAHVLGLSVDTVSRYVSYFEKAYLFYVVNKHADSPNEAVTSPKKIYIGDVGIKNMVTGFRDWGASYENLVFLRIKSLNPKYVSQNLVELDFRTKDMLIEAKYNQTLTEKQQRLFDALKVQRKIVANGVDFFLTGL